MKIAGKGQVTIPQEIPKKAGLLPYGELEFELRENGEVVIRPVKAATGTVRAAFARVRGATEVAQFKGMSCDELMTSCRVSGAGSAWA